MRPQTVCNISQQLAPSTIDNTLLLCLRHSSIAVRVAMMISCIPRLMPSSLISRVPFNLSRKAAADAEFIVGMMEGINRTKFYCAIPSPPAPRGDNLPLPCGQKLYNGNLFSTFDICELQSRANKHPVIPCILPPIMLKDILIRLEGVLQR